MGTQKEILLKEGAINIIVEALKVIGKMNVGT